LRNAVDEMTNTIVNEWCSKISERDWFTVNSISEDTISPIFYNEDSRAYVVKDYLFNYLSYSNE
jgi:hypothetical protein